MRQQGLLQVCFGAEGRKPISEPTLIETEGSYIVTNDFAASDKPAIAIDADNVTIDLDGHTLTLDNDNSIAVITNGTSGAYNDIHIRNGKLIGAASEAISLSMAGGQCSIQGITTSWEVPTTAWWPATGYPMPITV